MGKVAQPLRVAITGTQVSPDISHTVYLAGREQALKRIDVAITKTATACTAPHHHVHDASDFVAVVERVSRERGLRLTPLRANVLKLIAEAGKPVKAYELLEWVRNGKGVGADAPPTVWNR
ncbi:hypothetical protein G6F65_021021 [Rhizopus arrhizus]|nr:hypothetical protein G6F65_021021 [Rhizopus arrhizus]